MRIVNISQREAVDRWCGAQACIRDKQRQNMRERTCAEGHTRKDMRGYSKAPVNLGMAASDTAQLTPVATAYRALYMG